MAKKNIETKNFEDMTKQELMELCDKFGINVSARAKKEQIIKMLKSGSEATASKKENEKSESTDKKPADKTKKTSANKGGKKKGPEKKGGKNTTRPEAPAREKAASLAETAEAKPLTGKMIGRHQQLDQRERNLETAERLYNEPLERFMHSLDRLAPTTRRRRPEEPKRKVYDEEEIALQQSYDDPTFTLTGVIRGCTQTEHRNIGGVSVDFVWLKVQYGEKTIRIPSYHYFDNFTDKKKMHPKEIYGKVQHRVGAEIDFNMTERLEDPVTGHTKFYGTRILAAKVNRCSEWYEKYTDGCYCIENGDIVAARIMEVWPKTVVVEVGGAETAIPIWEITKRHISNIETQTEPKLRAGMTIPVMVSGIKREPLPENIAGFDYPVTYNASIKDAAPDPQELYFHDFEFGDTEMAIVTNIVIEDNPGGDTIQYYCQVIGKPVVVKCILVGDKVPKVDQEVRIRIKKTDPKLFRLYGEIFRVIPENRGKEEVAFTLKR